MATSVLWFDEKVEICDVLRQVKNSEGWKDEPQIKILALGNALETPQQETRRLREVSNTRYTVSHPVEALVEIYRAYCSKTPFCDSIFGLADQLAALQLVMAQINKEECGKFEAEASEVIFTHHQVIKAKLGLLVGDNSISDQIKKAYNDFLIHCNALDYTDLILKVSECFKKDAGIREMCWEIYQYILVLGVPSTDVEIQILKLLVGTRSIIKYSMAGTCEVKIEDLLSGRCQSVSQSESPSSVSRPQTLNPTTPLSYLSEQTGSSATPIYVRQSISVRCQSLVDSGSILPSPSQSPLSQGYATREQYVSSVFLSYLQLLVNTRDELALARVINTPNRELGLKQFTSVRKVAKEKNMTMFQMATSFILKIRLGGKSYAPTDDNPLLLITKGLGEFVSFFQKLQNVLEDITDAKTAVLKIIAILQSTLIKGRDEIIRPEDVRKAAGSLNEQVELLCRGATLRHQSVQKPSLIGVESFMLIRSLLDMNVLCDYRTKEVQRELKTPRCVRGKAHSLLTKFRTPDASSPESDNEQEQVFVEQLSKKPKNKSTGSVYGDMSWAKPAIATLKGPTWRTEDSMENMDNETTNSRKPCGIFNVETPKSSSRKRPWEGACRETQKTDSKSPSRKRPCESVNDQENIIPSYKTGSKQPSKKPTAKRDILNHGTAPEKNKKRTKVAGTKQKKFKEPRLAQGQKQLTHFFR